MPVPLVPPTQARAIATRDRLIDAAVQCMVVRGLAGATTTAIVAEAGVSQGALFKHFASKSDLLAAAIERILSDFVDEFARGVRESRTRPRLIDDVVADACQVLWSIFRSPSMRAVFEAYLNARTDDELARRLTPILRDHRSRIHDQARLLFPVIDRAQEDLAAAVDAVVHAMQGAALALFAPDDPSEVEQLAFLIRFARRELSSLPRVRRGRHV